MEGIEVPGGREEVRRGVKSLDIDYLENIIPSIPSLNLMIGGSHGQNVNNT